MPLPDGSYIVHAGLGLAGVTKRVVINGQTVTEKLVLNAGALRIVGLLGDVPINPTKLSIAIYVPERGNSEAKLVFKNARAGDMIGLPEGNYHVVSTLLDTTTGSGSANATNSVVGADLRVQAGKLTDTTLRHRAAVMTLKFVGGPGGEAMANTAFTILTPGGDVIRELIGAFPSLRACRRRICRHRAARQQNLSGEFQGHIDARPRCRSDHEIRPRFALGPKSSLQHGPRHSHRSILPAKLGSTIPTLSGRTISHEISAPAHPRLLAVLPILYNVIEPRLFGFPFFYWFQILLIPVSSFTIYMSPQDGRPMIDHLNWPATLVFVGFFCLVTILGFFAARWRTVILPTLMNGAWAAAGSDPGYLVPDRRRSLYRLYRDRGAGAVVYAIGAFGFFAVPYTILIYPLLYLTFPRSGGSHKHLHDRRRFRLAATAIAAGTRRRADRPSRDHALYRAAARRHGESDSGARLQGQASGASSANHRLRHPRALHLYERAARAGDDRLRQRRYDLYFRHCRDRHHPGQTRRLSGRFSMPPTWPSTQRSRPSATSQPASCSRRSR